MREREIENQFNLQTGSGDGGAVRNGNFVVLETPACLLTKPTSELIQSRGELDDINKNTLWQHRTTGELFLITGYTIKGNGNGVSDFIVEICSLRVANLKDRRQLEATGKLFNIPAENLLNIYWLME